jgi:hypothetical protein
VGLSINARDPPPAVASCAPACDCACDCVCHQSGSLELSTDTMLYLVSSMRDRGTSVTVYPEGMIVRNPRTWKPPMGQCWWSGQGVGWGHRGEPCVCLCGVGSVAGGWGGGIEGNRV